MAAVDICGTGRNKKKSGDRNRHSSSCPSSGQRYRVVGKIPRWLKPELSREADVQRYSQNELRSIVFAKYDKNAHNLRHHDRMSSWHCQHPKCRKRVFTHNMKYHHKEKALKSLIPKDWLCKDCLHEQKKRAERTPRRSVQTQCHHCRKDCDPPRSKTGRKAWRKRGWCLCEACRGDESILMLYDPSFIDRYLSASPEENPSKPSSPECEGVDTADETHNDSSKLMSDVVRSTSDLRLACHICSRKKLIFQYHKEMLFLCAVSKAQPVCSRCLSKQETGASKALQPHIVLE